MIARQTSDGCDTVAHESRFVPDGATIAAIGDTANNPGRIAEDMKLRREYRGRATTEVAVLEALADRYEEGMTVFELRSRVGADIDELERALSDLQEDGLITATVQGDRTLITVEERLLEEETEGTDERDAVDRILDRLRF
ncbi:MAG: DUF6432 family protein [Halodesulfurarchaeum sp.]